MTATALRTAPDSLPAKEGERAAARSAATSPARAASSPGLLLQRRCACGAGAGAGGECDSCARAALQRSGNGGVAEAAAPHEAWPKSVSETLARPGRALDADTRSFMEDRYGGHDFGAVRVHDDAAAAASARDVDAQAYTVGNHIAFGAGQYQPATESGRHLLAHELAHTVQQQGLQRAGTAALADHGPEYRRLEGEADRAADAVMRGGPVPALGAGLRAGGTRLSRKPAETQDLGYRKKNRDPKKKVTLTIESATNLMGYVRTSGKTADYTFEVLRLPPEKGAAAKAVYQSAKLKVVFTKGATRPTPVGNVERDPTDALRKSWLSLRPSAQADDDWARAGGGKVFPELKSGGAPCEVDHIQELQVGGTNAPANLQLLSKDNNGASGNLLAQQLRLMAEAALDHAQGLTGQPDTVSLSFSRIELAGAPKGDACLNIAQAYDVATGGGKALAAGTDFALMVGSRNSSVKLPSDATTQVELESSPYADNTTFAWGTPGLVFEHLTRAKGKAPNKLTFRLDTVMLNLAARQHGGSHSVAVSAAGVADLKKLPKAGVAFEFSKLSAGVLTQLDAGANGLAASGTIKPSLPFLPTLNVAIAGPDFKVTSALDPRKMSPPIPGLRFTRAELALRLAPEFKPEGVLAFDIGPASKRVASGEVRASADAAGLRLDGELYAYLPGVDVAKGEIHMSAGAWYGQVHIEASQMAGKIPFIQGGSVDITVKDRMLGAVGQVNLELPGGNKAVAELRYRSGSWQFYGRGRFHTRSPYLKPIDAELLYDGAVFTASGAAGFSVAGLDGTVQALYEHRKGHERVSGKGKLKIDKGRAQANLDVELLPSQKVVLTGKLSYTIKEGLVATAGVTVDERQKLTFDGELRLPPITLFGRIPPLFERHTIFEAAGSFPIPGASLGPLGFKIRLSGELAWYYYVGPGVLKNVTARVSFSPLEEKPDFKFDLLAEASIPAGGGIFGKVSAAAVLDAMIAEAGAELSVTAGAELKGEAKVLGKIAYAHDRYTVDALASIGGGVVLSADLKARVYAEAGVWRFKVRTEKVWSLMSGQFDTGLKLGLKVPLHYDSVGGFKMPGLADIQRDPQQLQINAPRMFGKLVDDTTPVETKR